MKNFFWPFWSIPKVKIYPYTTNDALFVPCFLILLKFYLLTSWCAIELS